MPSLGYYRFPAIHGDTIVFTAEGDLWRVSVNGGVAQRLTTHPAEESRAAISPDGKTIAFSAAYEGPTEVYTVPIDGGVPVRQTFEGRQCAGCRLDAVGRCALHDAPILDTSKHTARSRQSVDRRPIGRAARASERRVRTIRPERRCTSRGLRFRVVTPSATRAAPRKISGALPMATRKPSS